MDFLFFKANTEKCRFNYLSLVLFVVAAVITLSSCTSETTYLPAIEQYDRNVEVKQRYYLKLGVVSGPYGDMFTETMLPFLEKLGYSVELIEYGTYSEPNFALANYEIDMNMYQHYNYINNFKFQHNLNISAVTEIPTASMGLYSKIYSSEDEIEKGAVIVIPDDKTNLARALDFLDYSKLITVDPNAVKTELTVEDIIANEKNLVFILKEPENLVAALDNFELAVINGNFALSGGLDLSDALFNEVLSDNYINILAVRTEDLGELFVQDIIDIVYSDEYMDMFTDSNSKYEKFQLPRRFLANRGGVDK